MLTKTDTSILCPLNDGESKKIIEIANTLSLDLRVSPQKWGASLEKEPPESFLGLKPNVLIIEIPGPEKEAELAKDHTLYKIDHHIYGSLDRSNPLSSLEQFASLVGHTLDRNELGIALNDRGYIYKLEEEGYSREEILGIRRYDLSAQGYQKTDFSRAEAEYKKRRVIQGVTVVETVSDKTSYLSDIHFMNETKTEDGLLVVTLSEDSAVKEANFFGPPAVALRKHEEFGGYCGGDKNRSMFWGKSFDRPLGKEEFLGLFLK